MSSRCAQRRLTDKSICSHVRGKHMLLLEGFSDDIAFLTRADCASSNFSHWRRYARSDFRRDDDSPLSVSSTRRLRPSDHRCGVKRNGSSNGSTVGKTSQASAADSTQWSPPICRRVHPATNPKPTRDTDRQFVTLRRQMKHAITVSLGLTLCLAG